MSTLIFWVVTSDHISSNQSPSIFFHAGNCCHDILPCTAPSRTTLEVERSFQWRNKSSDFSEQKLLTVGSMVPRVMKKYTTAHAMMDSEQRKERNQATPPGLGKKLGDYLQVLFSLCVHPIYVGVNSHAAVTWVLNLPQELFPCQFLKHDFWLF